MFNRRIMQKPWNKNCSFFFTLVYLKNRQNRGKTRERWKLFKINPQYLKNKTYPLKIRYSIIQCNKENITFHSLILLHQANNPKKLCYFLMNRNLKKYIFIY